MTPQQQQRRAAQKLGVTVEKARQLFSEPDAPQPRRAPTPQQLQSMRKAQEAMDHYGLEENDIFITPDEIFEVIGKHLGISVEQAKAIWDPCPAPRDDGTFAPDGRTIPWAELTYCNPPFSQWSDWYIKAVAEVKMGKRVIFLMSQLSYFKSGQEKKGILLRGTRKSPSNSSPGATVSVTVRSDSCTTPSGAPTRSRASRVVRSWVWFYST